METEGISSIAGRQEQVRGAGQSEEVGTSLYMSFAFRGGISPALLRFMACMRCVGMYFAACGPFFRDFRFA